ncbi:MAG: hypothetical protein JNM66_23785 [Bryobacterales bacterium]|nr:hypothetical protein [Bryobacterales bacterium]
MNPGGVPHNDPVLPCQPGKCWIEIELLEEDGKPAAGEAYRVELPDGEMREGLFDKTGMIRFDNIACGICKVWFPGAEETEVMRVPAARYVFDWIELELLEEDGTACAGEPYWVRDPGGTVHEGELDKKGFVRIEPIPSGICQVRFPATAGEEYPVRTRARASQPPMDPAAPLAPWVAAQPLDWIEIELLDSEGGPIAGEPYWVKLADGAVREGCLNRNGFARLEGIPAGTCLVKFPGVDQSETERMTAPPAAARKPAEARTWIELELTDDDDVTPIGGAAYKVTLPDGAVREGTLDGNGRARLEGIPAGVCTVELPYEESECEKV